MLSSFYIGATGMKTHSQGMQVLGNNIANVNTVGYKSSEAIFANLMSQDVPQAANQPTVGISQLGMGATLSEVKTNFVQGGYESTNMMGDLHISGNGFFGVARDDTTYYTRAGNFSVNQYGYMIDPHGYILQGQSLYGPNAGTSGDIQFEANDQGHVVMAPSATTSISMITNLGDIDASPSATDPFFSLANLWNGTSKTPLSSATYAYSDSIRAWDDTGEYRDLNVYFDKANVSNSGGGSVFEFAIGMDPAEDGRATFAGTSSAGLLMFGTLSFDSAGKLQNMSAFTNDGTGSKSLDSWVPSGFDADGQPQFSVTYANGETTTISADFGLSNNGTGWGTTASNAAAVGASPSALPSFDGTRSATATTAHDGSSSSTIYSRQDGYGEGYMEGFTVNEDGVIIGNYSNGQDQDLYRINMYNFANPYGLSREGDNHYSATKASGAARQGFAGEDGLGAITQYGLETSNVELPREFVNMISTQRGFQANSKIITTSDSLLQTALQIKR